MGLGLVPYLSEAVGLGQAFILSGSLGLLWALVAFTHVQGVAPLEKPPEFAPRHGSGSSKSSALHRSQISSSSSEGRVQSGSSADLGNAKRRSSDPSSSSSIASTGSSSRNSSSSSSTQPDSETSSKARRRGLSSLLGTTISPAARRQVLVLCAAHAVMGWGFFLMQNWLPMYVSSLGTQALAETGKASSMPWLAAALVGMVAGSMADG